MLLQIPSHHSRSWDDQALSIWDYLDERRRLAELPEKLIEIDRLDLALLFYTNDSEVVADMASDE